VADSPFESVRLLLRRRVELRIVTLKLPLPGPILVFDGFPLAFPVQNKFRMDCALQFQERHAHQEKL
jgi:hypothetical protein